MKKNIIFAFAVLVALAFAFTACEKKAETKSILGYNLIEKNDKFGLEVDGFKILETEYDEIKLNTLLGDSVIEAKNGVTSTFVYKGKELLTAQVNTVEPAVEGFVYIYTSDGKILYKKGSVLDVYGPFEDIRVVANQIFFKDKEGWGAKGLTPRRFEKVYILYNDKTSAVAVMQNGKWQLFTKEGVTNGVPYDTPHATLVQELKPYDTSAEVGVLKTDLSL